MGNQNNHNEIKIGGFDIKVIDDKKVLIVRNENSGDMGEGGHFDLIDFEAHIEEYFMSRF